MLLAFLFQRGHGPHDLRLIHLHTLFFLISSQPSWPLLLRL